MSIVVSTPKGPSKANRKWTKTFVVAGKVLLQEDCDHLDNSTTRKKEREWVFLTTLYTRVSSGCFDNEHRVWCTPEVHAKRTTQAQREEAYQRGLDTLEQNQLQSSSHRLSVD